MNKPKIKEKRWNATLEKKILSVWNKQKVFRFDKNSKKKIFSIDTPPPYPSGRPWHIGAAAHYAQIDMIARTAKMQGNETYFPIGIDRNGVGVERYTEKKFNIKMHEMAREKFIELAKTALDDLEAEMIEIMKILGISGDFDNHYRTDSEKYRKLTQATFIELWKKGLIYEDTRPNNYCVDCKTTIADADIVYEDLPSQLFYIIWKIEETKELIEIATTRPELICACQAVIVNPNDERYKNLIGKHAVLPIYNRKVPIIANPIADPSFGSGILMICSYGDQEDVRLFRELKLKEIVAIDREGKVTVVAKKYAGLLVNHAREQIIKDLEVGKLIIKKEKINHRTPLCERSNTPVEIISMKEFYLKQLPFLNDLKKLQKKIKFHPEEHRQHLLNWINSITIDWPITRRRFYATEVPVWYCTTCNHAQVPEPGNYYQPWKDSPPFKKCEKCGNEKFKGDARTFDTWFDSSISAYFVAKYLRDKNFFKKIFPTTIRPQGKDIVRTWLYYSLLRSFLLTKEIPWEHAWISGYSVDEKGEKMSKSKGNVLDPMPILEKYGADVFRFWDAAEVSLGYDFRVSEQRIATASKFLTKLWNIARFISAFPVQKKARLTATDKWMLEELNKFVEECKKGYDDYNFFVPATKIREFTWNIFAAHYLEMVKKRAYGQGFSENEKKAAWYTLHEVMKNILLISHPIIPFETDFIWMKLYSKKSISREIFPEFEKSKKNKLTQRLLEFNSRVWEMKKEKGLSLKDEIEIKIPKELLIFKKDLVAMHNIKK
jgi:valyl-tRNA synthetase